MGSEMCIRDREYAELVKLDPVLTRALEQESLKQTKWYKEVDKKDAVQELYDEISVSTVPNTNLIRIAMTGTVETDLPEIVNAVANAFVSQSGDQALRNRSAEINTLQNQRRDLETQLSRIRNEITLIRGGAPVGGFEQGRNAVTIQIQALVQKLMELEVYEAQINDVVGMLKQQYQDKTIVTNPEVLAMVNANPQLAALENMKVTILTQLESLRRRQGPGPKHRQHIALEAQLDAIKMQITEITRDVTEEAVKSLIAMREGELAGIRAQILDLTQRYDEANARLKELEALMTSLQANLDEAEAIDLRIQKIDDRLSDMRMLTESPIEIRQPATLPREPSAPEWIIMMPLGVILGLVVGFGLAFLLEFMDTSITVSYTHLTLPTN